MKTLLIAFGCLMPLSVSVHAAFQCPDAGLIEGHIGTFTNSDEGKITLNSAAWSYVSDLTTSEVDSIKSLNLEISDIDEDTCNYLIYPTDSNIEDASLTLKAMHR